MTITNEIDDVRQHELLPPGERLIPVTTRMGVFVVKHVREQRGCSIAERAVTDAVRRRQLRTIRIGMDRFTCATWIESWLASCEM